MTDDIGKKVEEQAQESTKKVKAFFAGLDQWTMIAVIAALVMVFFGNFLAVANPFSLSWNFWITLACAVAIGAMVYLEMTQNKMAFKDLPLWLKTSLWVGIYVFITNLFGFIAMRSWFSPLLGIENLFK